eukprot:SAG11_NODE_10865_length_800_cov_1.166904_2_plen_102_part_01
MDAPRDPDMASQVAYSAMEATHDGTRAQAHAAAERVAQAALDASCSQLVERPRPLSPLLSLANMCATEPLRICAPQRGAISLIWTAFTHSICRGNMAEGLRV